MLKRMIIAETPLLRFLSDIKSRNQVLSCCDIVHFTDGIVDSGEVNSGEVNSGEVNSGEVNSGGVDSCTLDEKNLQYVLSLLKGKSEGKQSRPAQADIKLSLRLRPKNKGISDSSYELSGSKKSHSGQNSSVQNTHIHSGALSFIDPLSALIEKIIRIIDDVDYIELDAECDLIPAILAVIPAHKRIITRNIKVKNSKVNSIKAQNTTSGRITTPNNPSTRDNKAAFNRTAFKTLFAQYQKDSDVQACLYRFICDDGLAALEFLHYINNDKVIAYDEREDALWSRICASYKGAKVIFVSLAQQSHVSLDWLDKNYDIGQLPEKLNTVYGIIGDSIYKSFSPLVHNKGLRELNLPAIYLPFNIDNLTSLERFMARLSAINLPVNGLTVTAPLKATISSRYPAARDVINSAQSANVLKIKNNQALVETTDDVGLTLILEQQGIAVKGKSVAIIGCGCSGRIAASTLAGLGAQVTLFNRSPKRSALAHQLLKLTCKPLNQLDVSAFELLVNTVPFTENADISFKAEHLTPGTDYIDFVYNPFPNALLVLARSNGLKVNDGLTMLKSQLLSQFYSLTGQILPMQASQALERILSNIRKQDAYFSRLALPVIERALTKV